jgi:hypothetical protein
MIPHCRDLHFTANLGVYKNPFTMSAQTPGELLVKTGIYQIGKILRG